MKMDAATRRNDAYKQVHLEQRKCRHTTRFIRCLVRKEVRICDKNRFHPPFREVSK